MMRPSGGLRARLILPWFVVSATLTTTPAIAADEPGWLAQKFLDPEDGALDLSAWLDSGGFFPVPLIITEPAVDNGIGLAGIFLHGEDPNNPEQPPDVTGVAGAYTGNDSSLFAAFHQGSYLSNDLKYVGAIGEASINLDFFPGGGARGFGYNIEGFFTLQNARYRLADSEWFAGARWLYLDSEIEFRGGLEVPDGVSGNELDTRLSGLGPTVYFDDRDNIFTPRNGTTARVAFTFYDNAIGSDFNYQQLDLDVRTFYSPDDDWTLGLKGDFAQVFGNAPFFVKPFIQLRGIPAVRYQGDTVVAAELEAARRITPRWKLLGFTGVGYAAQDDFDEIEDTDLRPIVGGGVRYEIARQFGIDVGIDVAVGPEQTVVYLQFGHAWQRD